MRLLQNLENFRNDQIKKAKVRRLSLSVWLSVTFVLFAMQEEKKKFDKASQSYYSALEKHLSTSSKKKEMILQEVRFSETGNRVRWWEGTICAWGGGGGVL